MPNNYDVYVFIVDIFGQLFGRVIKDQAGNIIGIKNPRALQPVNKPIKPDMPGSPVVQEWKANKLIGWPEEMIFDNISMLKSHWECKQVVLINAYLKDVSGLTIPEMRQ